FCVLGIMETDLFPQVENAVHRFGDSRVFAFGFQRQDGSLGYSVNWHPSEDTYALAAERLAEFMKKSLQMKFEE
ncbi:MAG: hypothetical protein IJX77_09975, partial [Ruminococcus sp.]|nr:hypothetical protein [Ruminococcus sp.]